MTPQKHNVLVIGSGAAGLSLALRITKNASVTVLSKGPLTAASTFYAQGGVAAVLDETDSIEAHIEDTLRAGAGLCNENAVRHTVENGPESIQWLIDAGVGFTQNSGGGENDYHLTQEGGHSHRRIIHAADATGFAISSTLIKRAKQQSNIDLLENRVAIDLITLKKLGLPGDRCVGAYVLNLNTGHIEVHLANAVVLATGGASKSYRYTSNPDIATGDGIAMAWRAGCRVANMEFNQFHPTCLYHPEAKSFLVTEAIRGEGGILLLPNGQRFMHRFDKRAELAPRDIVARAIDHEMKRLGADCLYLDISHKSENFIIEHFPTVYNRCMELGIDISRQPIPIVPAAHYTCGGVVTDIDSQTDLQGLFAIGETSFTGLHGANRMASNSLLECFVFALSASKKINSTLAGEQLNFPSVPPWDESKVTDSDEDVIISHNWDELRSFMWDYVGIVRTDKRLQRAKNRIELLKQEINEYYSNYKISNDLLELRNLVTVSELIIRCAMNRKESRGLHFTLDYPETQDNALDSVLTPSNAPLFTARDPDLLTGD
ncbi:MAG: L-aspartate oxidase [Gammaproteobacteria bacterium]|nr:L-aspartate oxidase [Gammaproteobacteria bacterium]